MTQPPTADRSTAAGADPAGTVGSLVWAILGFNVLPLIGSIVAVVMGSNARRRARQAGQPDPSVARAGRILGWVGIVLVLVGVVSLVVLVAVGAALFDQIPQDLPEM